MPTPLRGSWDLAEWSGPPFSLTLGLDGAPLATSEHERAVPRIAAFLRTLHGLSVPGHGPLSVVDGSLRGDRDDLETSVSERGRSRPLWPLGDARLGAHAALAD